MLNLKTVHSELDEQGWSRQNGSVAELQGLIRRSGSFQALYGAAGQERVLVPYEAEKAPPRSLSAVYGLGAQPLHSDGAHLRNPPDIVVLHSALPTPTATIVWKAMRQGQDALPVAAANGVFTVRGNGESFLALSRTPERLRFDPVVMSPGDAYARQTVEYFAAARIRAHVHEWDEADLLLFIDNRRALHARNEATDAETRRVTRLAYRRAGDE